MNTIIRRYLTEDKQRQLLSTMKQLSDVQAQRDYAWMSLLIQSGFRITEFSLLTVGRVQHALKLGYLYIPPEHRKGKKQGHTKYITNAMRESFALLLSVHERMGYPLHPDSPLVISRKGNAMSVRAYQERTSYWAARAGIGDVSPHWFRHTRGMNIMSKSTSNDPRGIVQAELGHASIASTGIYTRISEQELINALEEVDGIKPRKRDIARLERAAA